MTTIMLKAYNETETTNLDFPYGDITLTCVYRYGITTRYKFEVTGKFEINRVSYSRRTGGFVLKSKLESDCSISRSFYSEYDYQGEKPTASAQTKVLAWIEANDEALTELYRRGVTKMITASNTDKITDTANKIDELLAEIERLRKHQQVLATERAQLARQGHTAATFLGLIFDQVNESRGASYNCRFYGSDDIYTIATENGVSLLRQLADVTIQESAVDTNRAQSIHEIVVLFNGGKLPHQLIK